MSSIQNAQIESADLDVERGLTLWLSLNYGGACQAFGGFQLYNSNFPAHDCGGFFITRVLETVGVERFSELKGQSIRVRADFSKVHEIGHFLKDVWFSPAVELEALRYKWRTI